MVSLKYLKIWNSCIFYFSLAIFIPDKGEGWRGEKNAKENVEVTTEVVLTHELTLLGDKCFIFNDTSLWDLHGKCIWSSNIQMNKARALEYCEEHGGLLLTKDEFGQLWDVKALKILKYKKKYWLLHDRHSSSPPEDKLSGDINECKYAYGDAPSMIAVVKTNCSDSVYAACAISTNLEQAISEKISTTISTNNEYDLTDSKENTLREDRGATKPQRSSGEQPSDLIPECPHGYNWKEDMITGYCYWETSYETARLSWEEAREYCKSYGGDLASFHDIREERIGLSFQFGAMAHPYWIGLRYDPDQEDFVWVDGSPVDYTSWAQGQPDDRNLRLRCVQMDAVKKEWFASYCGSLSWFICKAPKQINPRRPVLPVLKPLEPCDTIHDEYESNVNNGYFHDGYCYEPVTLQYDWARANVYCQNKDAELVSVHSEPEVDFLIKLLYEEKTLVGSRVWIGLHSRGLGNQLRWSDGTLLDFVNWKVGEPNHFETIEKCCTMDIKNGLWNDENCSNKIGFVCKRLNESSSEQVTTSAPLTPVLGQCRTGWHTFRDRCYLPAGLREKDWCDFATARLKCELLNGSLVAIDNEDEQVFLTFLLQSIKKHTWIGLHDNIKSGIYFWVGNKPLKFTNWALGEPSLFGMQEDCVHMIYDSQDSGLWRDSKCDVKLPFICESSKDPTIDKPWTPLSARCTHPKGWLKQGYSCFKFFNESKSWIEASDICDQHGAKLISISDVSVQAAFRYLSLEMNTSSWIGLFKNSNMEYEWVNGFPMTISNWEKGMPTTKSKIDLCFISSASGFWNISDCQKPRPFICQISSGNKGKLPSAEDGSKTCVVKKYASVDEKDNYCYKIEENVESFNAYFKCFITGGHLLSIHSNAQVESLKKYLSGQEFRNLPFFIGLARNKAGGFAWADGSPVNFEYWEDDEPGNSNEMCVEMKTETLKWRMVSCVLKRNAICSAEKESPFVNKTTVTPSGPSLSAEQQRRSKNEPQPSLSSGAIAAILVSFIIIIIALIGAYLYFKPQPFKHFRLQVASFENALYDADSGLELQEDQPASSSNFNDEEKCKSTCKILT